MAILKKTQISIILIVYFQKHHFRELSLEAQTLLGEDSVTFTNYWTSRFPLLLVHTWITIQCVAEEEKFKIYYHRTHRYSMKLILEQMHHYISVNPIERPFPYKEIIKNSEDVENNYAKKMKRMKRIDHQYSPRTEYQKNEMIKSAGLYRNHDLSDTKKVQNGPIYNKILPVKKSKKKSDEPLVWVLDK